MMRQPAQRGGCRTCFTCGLILLLLLIVVGVGGFIAAQQLGLLSGTTTLSTTPPPLGAQASATATAIIAADPTLLQERGQSLEDVQTLVDSGKSNQPFTLVVTQEQLTAELRKQLADQSDLPYSDPVIFLRSGNDGVIVRARVQVSNFEPVVTIYGNLAVLPDGSVTYNITNIDFGGIPVPDAARAQIAAQVKQAIDQNLAAADQNRAVAVTSIQVVTGRAIIEGHTK